jgi:hypothetical protein
MRRIKESKTGAGRKPRPSKARVEKVIYGKTHCYHCGGMLRVMPDEVSCVNCGRLADHKCERCLYREAAVAV